MMQLKIEKSKFKEYSLDKISDAYKADYQTIIKKLKYQLSIVQI
jgi:hypothetical protein